MHTDNTSTRADAKTATSAKTKLVELLHAAQHLSDWTESTSQTSWLVSESVPVTEVILRCTLHVVTSSYGCSHTHAEVSHVLVNSRTTDPGTFFVSRRVLVRFPAT